MAHFWNVWRALWNVNREIAKVFWLCNGSCEIAGMIMHLYIGHVESWQHLCLNLDDCSWNPILFIFFYCQKAQISSSAVNLQKCSQQWASYYVMVNLIIENLCSVFHIYWQNDSLFILTAGREFVPHSSKVLIIYRQQHICLKSNHCLSFNLSEPHANEPSFWLTAPHKLITAHTLHYSTIRLSIIL